MIIDFRFIFLALLLPIVLIGYKISKNISICSSLEYLVLIVNFGYRKYCNCFLRNGPHIFFCLHYFIPRTLSLER